MQSHRVVVVQTQEEAKRVVPHTCVSSVSLPKTVANRHYWVNCYIEWPVGDGLLPFTTASFIYSLHRLHIVVVLHRVAPANDNSLPLLVFSRCTFLSLIHLSLSSLSSVIVHICARGNSGKPHISADICKHAGALCRVHESKLRIG